MMETSGPGPPGPFSQPPALATTLALRPSAREVRKSPCSSICTIHSFIYNQYSLCFFHVSSTEIDPGASALNKIRNLTSRSSQPPVSDRHSLSLSP